MKELVQKWVWRAGIREGSHLFWLFFGKLWASWQMTRASKRDQPHYTESSTWKRWKWRCAWEGVWQSQNVNTFQWLSFSGQWKWNVTLTIRKPNTSMIYLMPRTCLVLGNFQQKCPVSDRAALGLERWIHMAPFSVLGISKTFLRHQGLHRPTYV